MVTINSIYFPTASDEANSSWDSAACAALKDIGDGHTFTSMCGNDTIEYHFNDNYTMVYIKIGDYIGFEKPVKVTIFKD